MKKYMKKINRHFRNIKTNQLWAIGFIGLGLLSLIPEKDATFLVFTLLIGIPAYFSRA